MMRLFAHRLSGSNLVRGSGWASVARSRATSTACTQRPCEGERRRQMPFDGEWRHPAAAYPSSEAQRKTALEPGEWLQRCDLAAAYRIAANHGWDQVVYNHISARVCNDHFLINPFGLRYGEVTASSLIKIDLEGNVIDKGSTNFPALKAGFNVHSAVHEARHDLGCVLHTHYSPTVVVSAHRAGFLPLSQEACIVMPKVSPITHPFEGVATDRQEMRERLVRNLGEYNVIFLQNHGILVGGANMAAALWTTWLVCRACEHQVAMMQAAKSLDDLIMPSEDVLVANHRRYNATRQTRFGEAEFDALKRGLDTSYQL
eukprot:TRINITY_DN29500_c0_g1_i1.p1 TRINITY_DN29500_c0_g1~~TRINITY_DN29500_c0_g1_i1.p1  ORF type:complete len:316 (-),score=21.99 TRINITY_DN29500_c0_g1_i1:417-1364(-)